MVKRGTLHFRDFVDGLSARHCCEVELLQLALGALLVLADGGREIALQFQESAGKLPFDRYRKQ
jgi:hypothetical protein